MAEKTANNIHYMLIPSKSNSLCVETLQGEPKEKSMVKRKSRPQTEMAVKAVVL